MWSGAIFTAWLTAWSVVSEGNGWLSALIGSAIGGTLFGVFMGHSAADAWRKWRSAVGELNDQEYRLVYRASVRGPVPSDPGLRVAAARAAEHTLNRRRRDWIFNIIFEVALVVVAVILSFTWSRWWLVALPVAALGAYKNWTAPRSLRRRIVLLSADTNQDPARPN